jgi:hypothetical protein
MMLRISVSVDITDQRTQRNYGSAYPAMLRISVPNDVTDQRTQRCHWSAYPSILRIGVTTCPTMSRISLPNTQRCYGSAYPSILRISIPVDTMDQRTRRYYGSAISEPVDVTGQRIRRYYGSAISVPNEFTDQRTQRCYWSVCPSQCTCQLKNNWRGECKSTRLKKIRPRSISIRIRSKNDTFEAMWNK